MATYRRNSGPTNVSSLGGVNQISYAGSARDAGSRLARQAGATSGSAAAAIGASADAAAVLPATGTNSTGLANASSRRAAGRGDTLGTAPLSTPENASSRRGGSGGGRPDANSLGTAAAMSIGASRSFFQDVRARHSDVTGGRVSTGSRVGPARDVSGASSPSERTMAGSVEASSLAAARGDRTRPPSVPSGRQLDQHGSAVSTGRSRSSAGALGINSTEMIGHQLSQDEKDSLLMELLGTAAVNGLGDIHIEQATSLLEHVSWKVGDALRQLQNGAAASAGAASSRVVAAPPSAASEHRRAEQRQRVGRGQSQRVRNGGSGARAAVNTDGSARGGGGGARSPRDVEHMRLQQEEWDACLAAEELRPDMEMDALMGILLQQQEVDAAEAAMMEMALQRSTGVHASDMAERRPAVDEADLARVTRVSKYTNTSEQEGTECSVCLVDFEPGAELRTLRCLHRFHTSCVDEWLMQKGHCPTCKCNVLE